MRGGISLESGRGDAAVKETPHGIAVTERDKRPC
jgi:hypothetical protein